MNKTAYEIAEAEEEALANVQGMVQRLLRSKKMKNKDLAAAMGVSEPHVSNLLNGDPKNLTIKAAARLFLHLEEELVFTCAGIQALDRAVRAKNGQPHVELCEVSNWRQSEEMHENIEELAA